MCRVRFAAGACWSPAGRPVRYGGPDDLDRWARQLDDPAAEHDSVPRRICLLCVRMLGITGAGISMVTNAGNRGVVCATDDVSARIEDIQSPPSARGRVSTLRTSVRLFWCLT